MNLKQPMFLERKNPDLKKISYPKLVSPKVDGLRGINDQVSVLRSRTLEPIPNREVTNLLSNPLLTGFDGELCASSPDDAKCLSKASSFFRSAKKTSDILEVPWSWYLFDIWNLDLPYSLRVRELEKRVNKLPAVLRERCILLPYYRVDSEEELLNVEALVLDQGYEGVVLRNPSGVYKQGRTTMKEDNAFKLKRFEDGEAVVIGMEPEMENTNAKEISLIGKSKRSTKKEGLVAKQRMGKLIVRDLVTNKTFKIGSGFDHEERDWWFTNWNKREWIIKYKHFNVGVIDLPRHPIFLSIREKFDM